MNYVVQDGEVLIVDEFTGRTMPGRRWSEGLHQAVEAKEGVQVKGETQTLATITIQNYFRMYDKLAGMTGTAETEETEFYEIYKLDVAVIPTNQPMVREDRHDLVYKTRREKYNAIVEETRRLHDLGFPVLVGTTSVEASETLSKHVQPRRAHSTTSSTPSTTSARRRSSPAPASRARSRSRPTWPAAEPTSNSAPASPDPKPSQGQGSRTARRSTSMEIGGLHIIGSERHESRRIDRQLRGRAGRQGDPGASQFFLSLEDDLMRLFGSERIARLMDRMGAQEGEVLTHPLITRSIEQAQKRVELQNFQARKRLLDYDDVMNQQREVIYSLRALRARGRRRAEGRSAEDDRARRSRTASRRRSPSTRRPTQWDFDLLRQDLLMHYLLQVPEFEKRRPRPTDEESARSAAVEAARKAFWAKLESLDTVRDEMGTPYGDRLLSLVMLNVLDEKWKDHLYDLDQLRNAIHYRSWGQKDPLIEYKQEAYTMFVDLMNDIYNTFS